MRRTWLFILLLFVLTRGCASPPPDTGPHPAWPPPPAPPRIVHRMDISQSLDLMRPSFLDALGQFIVGSRPVRLMRPVGVAMGPGDLLAVTDQELQALVLFNLHTGRMTVADRVGAKHMVSPVGVTACPGGFAVSDSALDLVALISPEGRFVRDIVPAGVVKRPTGLVFDSRRGELYVVDTLADKVRVFDLQGHPLRSFGGPGRDPGQFNAPTYIAQDAAGRLYVTDSLNFRVQILDGQGHYLSEFGRQGDATGYLAVPKGIGVDQYGHIYLVDSYTTNVQVFDAQGRFLLSFGQPGRGRGEFLVPGGLCVTADDRIFVCDGMNHRVEVFQYVGGSDHAPVSDSH